VVQRTDSDSFWGFHDLSSCVTCRLCPRGIPEWFMFFFVPTPPVPAEPPSGNPGQVTQSFQGVSISSVHLLGGLHHLPTQIHGAQQSTFLAKQHAQLIAAKSNVTSPYFWKYVGPNHYLLEHFTRIYHDLFTKVTCLQTLWRQLIPKTPVLVGSIVPKYPK